MLTVSIVIKSMPEVYIRRLLSQGTLGAMARRRSRPGSDHRHQPLRVLAGTALMLGSVAVASGDPDSLRRGLGRALFQLHHRSRLDLQERPGWLHLLTDDARRRRVLWRRQSSRRQFGCRWDLSRHLRLPDGSGDRGAVGVGRSSADRPQRRVRQVHLRSPLPVEHNGNAPTPA